MATIKRGKGSMIALVAWMTIFWEFCLTSQSIGHASFFNQHSSPSSSDLESLGFEIEDHMLNKDCSSLQDVPQDLKEQLVNTWYDLPHKSALMDYKAVLSENILHQQDIHFSLTSDTKNLELLERRARELSDVVVEAAAADNKIKREFLIETESRINTPNEFPAYCLSEMTEQLVLSIDRDSAKNEETKSRNGGSSLVSKFKIIIRHSKHESKNLDSWYPELCKIDLGTEDEQENVCIDALRRIRIMQHWAKKLDPKYEELIQNIVISGYNIKNLNEGEQLTALHLGFEYQTRESSQRKKARVILTERKEFLESIASKVSLSHTQEVEMRLLAERGKNKFNENQRITIHKLRTQEKVQKRLRNELAQTVKHLREINLEGNISKSCQVFLNRLAGCPYDLDRTRDPSRLPRWIRYSIEDTQMAQHGYLDQKFQIAQGIPSKYVTCQTKKRSVRNMLILLAQKFDRYTVIDISEKEIKYERKFRDACETGLQEQLDERLKTILKKLDHRKVVLQPNEAIIWRTKLAEADKWMAETSKDPDKMAKMFLRLCINYQAFEPDDESMLANNIDFGKENPSPLEKLHIQDAALAFEELIWNKMADVDKILFALKLSKKTSRLEGKEFMDKIKVHGFTMEERFCIMYNVRKLECPSMRLWVSNLYAYSAIEKETCASAFDIMKTYQNTYLVNRDTIDEHVKSFDNILQARMLQKMQSLKIPVLGRDSDVSEKGCSFENVLQLMNPFTFGATRPQRILMASTMGEEEILELIMCHNQLTEGSNVDIKQIWNKVFRIVSDSIIKVEVSMNPKEIDYMEIKLRRTKRLMEEALHQPIESFRYLTIQEDFFVPLLEKLGLTDRLHKIFFSEIKRLESLTDQQKMESRKTDTETEYDSEFS